MNVAQTILQQLGGNKFIVMTGAKNFGNLENGITFSLPANFAKNKINLVEIKLNADDLYDVTYYNRRGINLKEISKSEGIYCDMLQSDFTATTGLDTRM